MVEDRERTAGRFKLGAGGAGGLFAVVFGYLGVRSLRSSVTDTESGEITSVYSERCGLLDLCYYISVRIPKADVTQDRVKINAREYGSLKVGQHVLCEKVETTMWPRESWWKVKTPVTVV